MRWIIGDIHGMLAPLKALIAAVERADPRREPIFVGDYVNRGPHSRGVVDFLLSLKGARFVRGNHDDVFDHVLSNSSYAGEPGKDFRAAAFVWFMQHGLDRTFQSYGLKPAALQRALRNPTKENLDFLADAVPAEHKAFIHALVPVIEEKDFFVAHAKWDIHTTDHSPTVAQQLTASHSNRYALVWGRYRPDEAAMEKLWSRTGYFGHTPVDTYTDQPNMLPVLGPKIVLLDTAVALVPHGRLTAYCHETGQFIQSDPQGNIVVQT